MGETRLNIDHLNKVINSTIEAVEKGQKEIYNILSMLNRNVSELRMS